MNIFNYRNKRNKGFTLIELLVVISIIGMLSSVVLVSLQSARVKARETKLFVEVKELQKALELYRLDNGSYPGGGSWYSYTCVQANFGATNALTDIFNNNFTSKYISKIPEELTTCGLKYAPSTATTNVTGYKCGYIGQVPFEWDGFDGVNPNPMPGVNRYGYVIVITTSENSFNDYPVLYSGANPIPTNKCILGPVM